MTSLDQAVNLAVFDAFGISANLDGTPCRILFDLAIALTDDYGTLIETRSEAAFEPPQHGLCRRGARLILSDGSQSQLLSPLYNDGQEYRWGITSMD